MMEEAIALFWTILAVGFALALSYAVVVTAVIKLTSIFWKMWE